MPRPSPSFPLQGPSPPYVPRNVLGFHAAALADPAPTFDPPSGRALVQGTWRTVARQAAAYFLAAESRTKIRAGLLLVGPPG